MDRIIENFASFVVSKLDFDDTFSYEKKVKVQYSLKIIFSELLKTSIIFYVCHKLFDSWNFIWVLLTLFMLKRKLIGLHMDTTLKCLLVSLLIVNGILALSSYIHLNNVEIYMIALVGVAVFITKAPTKSKNHVIHKSRKRVIKIKGVMAIILIECFGFLIKGELQQLISMTIMWLSIEGIICKEEKG